MYKSRRKILSALCHGAAFFSYLFVSIAIPIAVLLLTEDPVVKENAKESFNFHINLYIYAFCFAMLIFVLIGIPLLILLGVASLIMPIIAIIQVLNAPDKPYRYPFILIRLE